MANKTYEVTIEVTTTRIVHVSANNRGMAQIKAKAGAGDEIESTKRVAVKSVTEKELAS